MKTAYCILFFVFVLSFAKVKRWDISSNNGEGKLADDLIIGVAGGASPILVIFYYETIHMSRLTDKIENDERLNAHDL